MKQLYTLLALMLVFTTAQARKLTFYMNGTPVEKNSTVYFSNVQAADYNLVIDPNITAVSDINSNTVQFTATCTSGQTIQMCAGGQCEFGTTVTKKNVRMTTGQALALQFEYTDYDWVTGQPIPTVTTEIEGVFLDNDGYPYESSRFKFTIVMGQDVSSIADLALNKDQVKYTPAGIEYSLSAPSTLSIYSITGAQVYAAHAEGHGTVNTHALRPGLYIYSVANANGKTTGKIYVK